MLYFFFKFLKITGKNCTAITNYISEGNSYTETMSILNSHSIYQKRLGEILIEADLVSIPQINVALKDQIYSHYLSYKRLGEILSMSGWIRQETADFFALDWPNLIQQNFRRPLGWYLHQSKLLEEKDINKILEEQKTIEIRFGTLAVLQGYLKKTTLDFFLIHLFPKEFNISPIKNINNTLQS